MESGLPLKSETPVLAPVPERRRRRTQPNGNSKLLIAAIPGPEAQLIYCHMSSYTFELGKILKENYYTPEKARELISHGDASSISKTLEHSIFHHRDQVEPLNMQTYGSIQQALDAVNSQEALGIGYVYLFNDSRWAFMTITADCLTEPMPVTPETMADDLATKLKPAAHDEYIRKIAGDDQSLAERLKKRI